MVQIMNIKSSQNNISFFKKRTKIMPVATTIKVKPIKATPEVSGKYAKEIIAEALLQPSPKCIERNKAASDLLKKLRS